MSFARTPTGRLDGVGDKPNTRRKIREGTDELKRRADQINRNPNVVAAKDATKKGIKKVGDTVAGLFGLGKGNPEPQQPQSRPAWRGGKRRRKSRRKKRTKRRRKSRRKKRRTKRRRKSRRKRRR